MTTCRLLLLGPALVALLATSAHAQVPILRADSAGAMPLIQDTHNSRIEEALCAPLLLDSDYGLGTSVVFRRIPNGRDLEDLQFVTGLRQVLVALAAWPASYEALQPMQQAALPQGVEFVVVLPGWPPTREAVQAWNYVRQPMRIVLVVPGPPADRAMLLELNRMRALERVIVQMENPARTGFERLQRPLSFRVLRP